jgi:phosphoserine phosphatase
MRPAGVLAVAAEVNSGAEVTICSASPALVLQPWADKLGIKLIGTQLEVKNGKLTGRITGNNCRCAEGRQTGVYGNLNDYHLRAWGDTRGDHELLAAAQDPHWRFHHPRKRRNSTRVSPVPSPPSPTRADIRPHVCLGTSRSQ